MEPARRLKPQVVLLAFAALLNDTASEMIYPLLPLFLTATLGASPLAIGIIEGAAEAIASLLKLVSGAWSDRVPRRKPFIVTGYGLAALSRLLIAAATVWPIVLAARLVDRTGKGLRSAPRDALIADVTPPADRGRAFGFHRALDHTGALIGPLIAFALLYGARLPLRTMIYLAVIPGAVAALMLLFLLREERRPVPSTDAGEIVQPRAPMSARFRGAMVAVGLFALANSSDAFLILQAHRAGVSAAIIPLLWGAHHVIKVLFSTAAGSLSDRHDRRRLLIAGWLSYAVIYAFFPHVKGVVPMFGLFIAYAIPFTLTEGAERAWIGDLVTPETRGRGFGIYYLTNGLGVFAGTLLFASIYEVSPSAAFATGATLALAAAAAVVLLTRLHAHAVVPRD